MLRHAILSGTLLGVVSAMTLSQTPVVQECNEEFARFLVEQQVSESRNVEETDKRVRILIRAAEFLWKFEEPVGREYFAEAFKVANDRYHEKGFEKVENKGMTTRLPDYRFEVIKAIAAKDSQWANKLIEQVLKGYEKDWDRKDFDRNREVEETMSIAVDSVKTNPELSRLLLRRIMQHPLDFHWFWAPFTIAASNRALADSLYAELLTNYANSSPRRLLFLSAYPFASERILGIEKYQYGAWIPPTMSANKNLQRLFIGTFIQRVKSFAADPQNLNLPLEEYRQPEPVYMVAALAELEPIVIEHHPDLIQQLSEARAQATGMLNEEMRKTITEREKRNEALGYGFERRLKQLEEAEAEGKLNDQMIVSLLTWGSKKTEEQFKQIEPWLAKIQHENGRKQAFDYFWFTRAELAVDEKRLDDAVLFAKKIPGIEHRAILFSTSPKFS